jgi:hypothetical protein
VTAVRELVSIVYPANAEFDAKAVERAAIKVVC